MRQTEIHRTTSETDIQLKLNLDGTGVYQVHTGVGFFDHMLAQLSAHGLLDLTLQAQGDLGVDCHHLIEDCGIVLGKAFDQCLGGKEGIVRMGMAIVPMDDSLARVVVDFSGRPYAVLHTAWSSPNIGQMPCRMVDHFLHSWAMSARANLHARVLEGADDHHMAEALFKAFGRAVDQAKQIDPRRGGRIPSTKGVLS
jgi:imidazoleglycerol-phosphate dehydratase